MNKLQIVISTLLLSILACSSSVPSAELTANVPTYDIELKSYKVCDCESLNVRAGAGTEFPTFDNLYVGNEVEYITETYSEDGSLWYVIKLGDGVGYVRAKYVCQE